MKLDIWDIIKMKIFLVFMWCIHIPKLNITFPSEVLVSSHKRPYGNLMFHSVLAQKGSFLSNRACLNFQDFALFDIKMAAWEGFWVGQKWVIALVIAN